MSAGKLLAHGGYSLSFASPGAGRLVMSWYLPAKGAHSAKAAKAKPVLVASASTVLRKAGQAKVHVVLSAAGRRLLRSVKRITLTAKATFTPAGARAVTVTKTSTLKR